MAVNAITTEQLALVLGVSDRHIRRLVSQGVLTRLKTAAGDPMPGHYDLVSSVRAGESGSRKFVRQPPSAANVCKRCACHVGSVSLSRTAAGFKPVRAETLA